MKYKELIEVIKLLEDNGFEVDEIVDGEEWNATKNGCVITITN